MSSAKVVGAKKSVLEDNDNLAIQQGINGGKLVSKWTNDEVANWLNEIGFQDCVQVFKAHSVNGAVVPRLTPELLREMGIQSVGRRIELQAQIVSIQAKARSQWRNEVLWAEEEYRAGPCNGVLPFGFPCCFETCTGKPEIYKVTNSKINRQIYAKKVNLPGCGFCGHITRSENTDLSECKDIDVGAMTSVVGDPPGTVSISTNSGKVLNLVLKSSQCQKACAIITNAKEECVIQEGLQKFGRG